MIAACLVALVVAVVPCGLEATADVPTTRAVERRQKMLRMATNRLICFDII
jgi:hypothetical protein